MQIPHNTKPTKTPKQIKMILEVSSLLQKLLLAQFELIKQHPVEHYESLVQAYTNKVKAMFAKSIAFIFY